MSNHLLSSAINEIGITRLANACGIKPPSVFKWKQKGLPRTEWTGETKYSEVIERLSDGAFTKAQLLATRQAA